MKWLAAILVCVAAPLMAQVTSPMQNAHVNLFDASGAPCVGCKLYSFIAGSTTPQATYTDEMMGGTNTNPIVLGTAGDAIIWLGTNSYKFRLDDANGTTLWTVDYVSGFVGLLGNYVPIAGGHMTGELTAPKINKVYYVDGTVYPYTSTGLQAALSAAGTGGNYVTSTVIMGAGSITTNTTINVPPNVILKGAGQQNSRILAGPSFPTGSPTPLLNLGTADGVNWNNTINATRAESLTLDCNSVANSIGGYSRNANENSGFIDVTAHACPIYGFEIDGTHSGDSGNPTPSHWMIRDSTVCCSTDTAGIFDNAGGIGRIENVTVNTPSAPAAIEALGTGSNTCFDLQILQLHTEGTSSTDGVYAHASGSCGTSNRLAIWGYEATGSPTNMVHIGSANVNVVDIDGNLESNGTNLVKNDYSGTTVTVANLARNFYHFGTGGTDVLGLSVAFDEFWRDVTGYHVNGHGIALNSPTGQQVPIVTTVGAAGSWKWGGGGGAFGDDQISFYSTTYGPTHGFAPVFQCGSTGDCYIARGLQIALGTTMTSNQGDGTKLQHSTGSTTTDHYAKFDSAGNTVDAGAPVGRTCNSNGCYIQYADGTFHMWGVSTSVSGTPTAQSLTITFPTGFSTTTGLAINATAVADPAGDGNPHPADCHIQRSSVATSGANAIIAIPTQVGGSGYTTLVAGDYCAWTADGN